MTEYMDPQEFHAEGYLQEVNRRFLHPLGLSLAWDGQFAFAVVDQRDDPRGTWYELDDDGVTQTFVAKMDNVQKQWNARYEARQNALGFMIQPENKLRAIDA